MALSPLHDRIIVQRLDGPVEDTGKTTDAPFKGKVVVKPAGRGGRAARRTLRDVKEGDTVLFGKYSGQEITIDGEDYLVLKEDEVLAVNAVREHAVFISYPRSERAAAGRIAKLLQEHGFSAWMDSENLSPGGEFLDTIERAVDNSSALIFVVAASEADQSQEFEWRAGLRAAWERPDVPLVPVVLRGAKPPVFLGNWQALRWHPGRDDQQFFNQLLTALETRPASVPGGRTRALERQRQQRLEWIEASLAALQRQRDSAP